MLLAVAEMRRVSPISDATEACGVGLVLWALRLALWATTFVFTAPLPAEVDNCCEMGWNLLGHVIVLNLSATDTSMAAGEGEDPALRFVAAGCFEAFWVSLNFCGMLVYF